MGTICAKWLEAVCSALIRSAEPIRGHDGASGLFANVSAVETALIIELVVGSRPRQR